ncbi:MAG: CDP-diacylglycerol--serine O-phosphatidyltransferase [Actinomycetota bacterium]|nr:CDP-diacylglycerol--serine O-phosphatidyltransferase [Actinomycetota bacterium]MDQ3648523.1 CDP-diacylglycerol--serine O-phosphatidyltransferase [Actinomycetota bacterium]
MSGRLSPANLLTSGNLAAGFLALILAEQGEFAWAAGCVGAAAVCDSVDGLVARLTKSECEFGSQLDSLADLVSFGISPALIVYLSTLQSLPVAGIAACLGFVLCGGWRLARFQVDEESRHRFIGLPIPPAGVITVVLAILDPSPGLALAIVVVLGLLMVSRLPFPTLAELRRLAHPARRARVEAAQATRK